MKSNYTPNRPLMKMSPLEMVSSRPQHESRKPITIIATTISMETGLRENKGFKK